MHRVRLAAIAMGLLIGGMPGDACAASPSARCFMAKLDAAGRKVAGKMTCQARAIANAAAVDPACLARAETRFSAAMAKAGNVCPGDTADLESKVDQCVSVFLADVPGTGRCPSASARAVGKAARSELACGAKDIAKPGSFSACHARADSRLAAALVKAGACGQSGTIQADVDTCEQTLDPPYVHDTTSTTSSTSTTTTTAP
jgi:hypothetical protein